MAIGSKSIDDNGVSKYGDKRKAEHGQSQHDNMKGRWYTNEIIG